MGYTRTPGKGESDKVSRSSYARTGKHDVKDKGGGQSKRYSGFLKTGDPSGGGRVSSGSSGLAPEARDANRAVAKASASGQTGHTPRTSSGYGMRQSDRDSGIGFGADPAPGTPIESKYGYKKSPFRIVAEQGFMTAMNVAGIPTGFWDFAGQHEPVQKAVKAVDEQVYVPSAEIVAQGADLATGGLITDTTKVYELSTEYISSGVDRVHESYVDVLEVIKEGGDLLPDIVGEAKDFTKLAIIGLAAVAVIMLAK